MIARVEELERRVSRLTDELIATKARLQAADDRVMQVAGALPPLFGASSAFALGRAVGTISALAGSTFGSGTVNFAVESATTLTEGSESTAVKNPSPYTIADNAWVLIIRLTKAWFVFPLDCADLS